MSRVNVDLTREAFERYNRGEAEAVVDDLFHIWIFTWRDRKVVEVREYRTKAEALEAVGRRQ